MITRLFFAAIIFFPSIIFAQTPIYRPKGDINDWTFPSECYNLRGNYDPLPPNFKIPHTRWHKSRGSWRIGGNFYPRGSVGPYNGIGQLFLGYEIEF